MKQTLLIISCLVVHVLAYPLAIYADDDNIKLIATYEEDINGNGLKEIIKLRGILLSKDQSYYQNVWIDIINQFGEESKISYGGGYNPRLELIDLNNDATNDVYFQNSKDNFNKINTYHLHTFKENKVVEIPLPQQENMSGKFVDQFNVAFKLSPTLEPTVINVADRSATYIDYNIYDKQGRLLKEQPITLNPWVKFEPLLISAENGYLLKSYQDINGAFKDDQVATIETLWHYDKDLWTIIQTDIIQSLSDSK